MNLRQIIIIGFLMSQTDAADDVIMHVIGQDDVATSSESGAIEPMSIDENDDDQFEVPQCEDKLQAPFMLSPVDCALLQQGALMIMMGGAAASEILTGHGDSVFAFSAGLAGYKFMSLVNLSIFDDDLVRDGVIISGVLSSGIAEYSTGYGDMIFALIVGIAAARLDEKLRVIDRAIHWFAKKASEWVPSRLKRA